jgi:hypothetical protein
MKFSYNAIWDYTLALLRAHFPLVVAIAGVFIFLPTLLIGYFFPAPDGSGDPQSQLNALLTYYKMTWPWQLLDLIVVMIGTLAVLILLLDRMRPTVGGAIVGALKILPFYLLATLLVGFALGIAIIVILLPISVLVLAGAGVVLPAASLAIFLLFGYVLFGRLSVLSSVMAVEQSMPIGALRRALELTRGHGWAIFGLVLVILMAGGIASLAVGFVVGGMTRLLFDTNLADFIILLVDSLLNSVLAAFVILVTAAIYRVLSGSESTAALFE